VAYLFLETLSKLRKATISFYMPVCLVCQSAWNNLTQTKTDFHEIWYLRIFQKSVEKIQFYLKYDKKYGYLK